MTGSITALVETLVANGATPELILAMVRTAEAHKDAALEKSREKARNRIKKWREKQPRNVTERSVADTSRLTRGEINSSNKKISGEGRKEESAPAARPVLDGFKAELSSILDPERIEALVAVRRKKGATMTPHAGRLLAKALAACPNVAEAADEMVLRNWTGVKPEWLERQRSTATAPPQPFKPNGLMAAYGRSQERERNGREDSGGGADVERVPVDNRQLRLIAGHISAAARGPID